MRTMLRLGLRTLGAKELVFITDVDGILHEGNLVKETDESEIATFIETGVITGGMIPKVQALASLKWECKR